MRVPGISRMFGARSSSQASATCTGVAPSRAASERPARDRRAPRRTPPGRPSGQNGTNAMSRAAHSRGRRGDRWSARLKRFCTQTISVWARPAAGAVGATLLSPMPSISPSSRAATSAASWLSNRSGPGSRTASSRRRRFTAASRSTPSVARLSSIPGAQLVGLVEAQQRAGRVAAARPTLLTIARLVRVGVQRLADELVDDVGPVVLRGVDVVDADRDGRAEYPQRVVAIARRPEDPVAGELHGAVPGPAHAPRAEREGPAERALLRLPSPAQAP